MKYPVQAEVDNLAISFVNARELYKTEPTLANRKSYKELEQQLFSKVNYIVQHRTSKYAKFSNHEDLIQDAYEGLMMALETYKIGKGAFTWWADQYIKTRVVRAANAHSTIRVPIKVAKEITPNKISLGVSGVTSAKIMAQATSLKDGIHSRISDFYGLNLGDVEQKTPEKEFEMRVDASKLHDALMLLSTEKQEYLNNMYFADQSMKDTAAKFNTNPFHVAKVAREAYEELREELEEAF